MHKHQIRVRYQETDKMGIVYNSNYLVWFEIGRTEYCRQLGISYREMEDKGVYLPVVEAVCRYRKPAYYDDLITIETTVSKLSPVRIVFSYQITRGNELLVTGETTHGFTTLKGKVVKLNKEYQDVWEILNADIGGKIS